MTSARIRKIAIVTDPGVRRCYWQVVDDRDRTFLAEKLIELLEESGPSRDGSGAEGLAA